MLAWWLIGPEQDPSRADEAPSGDAPSAVELVVPVDAFAMTVEEVVDGDTFRASVQEPNGIVSTPDPVSVRLVGLDAPEVYPRTECWGAEAEDALRDLLPASSTVMVAPDRDAFDRYGRRLFHVWADGAWVGGELVAGGHAEARRYWPNVTHHERLEQLEATAREASRGQWGACEQA